MVKPHHQDLVSRALVSDAGGKQAQFPRRYQQFADAQDYSQWQFIFIPPIAQRPAAASQTNPSFGPAPGAPPAPRQR